MYENRNICIILQEKNNNMIGIHHRNIHVIRFSKKINSAKLLMAQNETKISCNL